MAKAKFGLFDRRGFLLTLLSTLFIGRTSLMIGSDSDIVIFDGWILKRSDLGHRQENDTAAISAVDLT